MSRKATATNITLKPGVGLAVVIKEVATGSLIRAATLCIRDKGHEPLSSLSGPDPFFKAKIGKKRTGFTYLTFKCGADQPTCLTDDGKYEWMNLSLKDARAQGLAIVGDSAETETEASTDEVPGLESVPSAQKTEA